MNCLGSILSVPLWLCSLDILPAFTITRKLKAHGSSQACFEFSNPDSPAGGPSGLVSLVVCAVRLARPGLL